MITAVLDTNVLASGIVGYRNPGSVPGQLLRAWRQSRFELIVSEPILTELSRTLAKPYFRRRLTAQQLRRTHRLLRRRTVPVRITTVVTGVATHPEDDLILSTALSAQAGYLVTGDHQLRSLGSHGDTTILNPREFLDMLAEA